MHGQSSYSIRIEKMVPGGLGLGHLEDGMVVLVRHVLPGEEVVVRPLTRRKQYIEATLTEVLTPSADRSEPVCNIYSRCGGCDLQHANYTAQLRIKEGLLRENLARSQAPYQTIAPLIAPPLASPRQYGYRQRIRLHAGEHGVLGFRRFKSHEIVPAAACPLAQPPINDSLAQLQAAPLLPELLRQTIALELHLNPATDKVVAVIHYQRRPRPAELNLIRRLEDGVAGLESIAFFVAGHGFFTGAGGPADPDLLPLLQLPLQPLAFGAEPLTLAWEAGGFCQVNLEQNVKMIRQVLGLAQIVTGERVLDLYCGMGNFSLPLAQSGGVVLGLDGQGAAIRSARRNAVRNNLLPVERGPVQGTAGNCLFEKVPVEAGVSALAQAGRRFDLILLDPPRQGAAGLIPHLAALGARRLIYISCDPATLARDLAGLTHTGFAVRRLVPLDMFPHTHHLETITLLERD